MEAGIGIVRARRSIIPESRDHLGGIKVYFRVSQLHGDDEKCELYFLEGFRDDVRPWSALQMRYTGKDVSKPGLIA